MLSLLSWSDTSGTQRGLRVWGSEELTLEDRDYDDVEDDDGNGCKIDNGIGQWVAREPILAELLSVRELQVGYLKAKVRFLGIKFLRYRFELVEAVAV